ncbi:DUF4123 domain-containing protein [Trinickia sp. YCB016]
MNEIILLDAAIWREADELEKLMRTAYAVALYADLPSAEASLFGPWLLNAADFDAIVPIEGPLPLPWRYAVSRLSTQASLDELVAHFESQRSIAMSAGDRYYLRFADTRALATLERVLTPEQVRRLKGPVAQWRYTDRFDDQREFGAGAPADVRRQKMIVLSEQQEAMLFELQLAGALADEVVEGSGGRLEPQRLSQQYRQVEAAAAFALKHGIEPFTVQRHIAKVTVESEGVLLTNERFLARVESLRASGRWHELMRWRVKPEA